MSIAVPYVAVTQDNAAIMANIITKGFTKRESSSGCTYIVMPPTEYQSLFLQLQEVLAASGLPIAEVRIPHATLIAAKVIDKKPEESWTDLEEVQRVYKTFLCYHVHKLMLSGLSYREASLEAVRAQERTLATIAATSRRTSALEQISDLVDREAIEQSLKTAPYARVITEACTALSHANFSLKFASILLANSGSILFQLEPKEELLHMRIDLIIAGQGISKWPNLTNMKNAWSVIGYTTTILTAEQKETLDAILTTWTHNHQEVLQRLRVPFSMERLGALAFKANDFNAVRSAVFPLASDPTHVTAEELLLSPRTKHKPLSPIAGDRDIPEFPRVLWTLPVEIELAQSPMRRSSSRGE